MSVFQWAEKRLLIRKGTALPRMNQFFSFLFYRQSLSLLTFRTDDICLSQLEEEKNSRSVQLRSEWMAVAYLIARGDWSIENGRKGQVYQWWKSFNVARLEEWRAKTLWRRHHMSLLFIWTENPLRLVVWKMKSSIRRLQSPFLSNLSINLSVRCTMGMK